jgi:photosystem II stability/assembly factor-like uncharacterized protein
MKIKSTLVLLLVFLVNNLNWASSPRHVAAKASNQAMLSTGVITLPRSGQTTSYYAGDDGALQRGAAWPTTRFSDLGDGSVTDTLTGLVWVKDFNLMLTHDPAFDTDGAVDGAVLWPRALDYVARLNTEAYLGHSDWRMPNRLELTSLQDASQTNPYLPAGHPFTNVMPLYWSSTTHGQGVGMAWHALFGNIAASPNYKSGQVNGLAKRLTPANGFEHYVSVVRDGGAAGVVGLSRSGQTRSFSPGDDGELQKGSAWPTPRFVDHGDGTVTDRLTGLMWTRDVLQGGSNLAWTAALDYVAGMNAGTKPNYAHSGWRMPNLIEARSLLDLGRPLGSLALSEGHPFTNTSNYSNHLWTSTTAAFDTSQAWVVNQGDGSIENYNKTTALPLWAVRDAPTPLVGHAIRGQVTLDGQPLAGVKVTLSGPLSGLTLSGINGEYAFTYLPDGAYTLTAQKLYYALTPTSLPVTLAGVDQSGKNLSAAATRAYGWTDISAPLLKYATNFSAVEFIGAEGWLTSAMFPEIYHTPDGGQTWEVQTISPGFIVNGIAMRNPQEGYAIAQADSVGRLFRTTDGGAHWISLGSTGTVPRAIDCPPAGTSCFLVGDSGKFIKITGTTLTPYLTNGSSNLGSNLYFVSFPLDDTAGWWGGLFIIQRFENDQLIADQLYDGSRGYRRLFMLDLSVGWAVGDDGSIGHTLDGRTWNGQLSNSPNGLNDVTFFDVQEGWAVGDWGTILHTTNGGGTRSVSGWNTEAAGLTPNPLRSITAVNRTTLYAAGNEITLLKYQLISTNVAQFSVYLPLLRR